MGTPLSLDGYWRHHFVLCFGLHLKEVFSFQLRFLLDLLTYWTCMKESKSLAPTQQTLQCLFLALATQKKAQMRQNRSSSCEPRQLAQSNAGPDAGSESGRSPPLFPDFRQLKVMQVWIIGLERCWARHWLRQWRIGHHYYWIYAIICHASLNNWIRTMLGQTLA